jgi:hypothetical protein
MRWSDIDFHPSRSKLRQFGVLSLLVGAGLTAWSASGGDLPQSVGWIGGALALAGFIGLVMPPAIRALFVILSVAAFPIGWIVSRVALGVLFFLVVTPIGLIHRARGRDALRLKRREAATYWLSRDTARHPERYLRQF